MQLVVIGRKETNSKTNEVLTRDHRYSDSLCPAICSTFLKISGTL